MRSGSTSIRSRAAVMFSAAAAYALPAIAGAQSSVDRVLPYTVIPSGTASANPQTARSGSVYSNVDPLTFQGVGYYSGGATQVGANLITNMLADDITTTTEVTGGLINTITFSYFNNNTVTTNFRVRTRYFAADGANGGPGTYLTGASLLFENEPALSGGRVYFDSSTLGLNMNVGTTIWAGIAFDNDNGSLDTSTGANFANTTATQLNNLGQSVYDPPTVGSSQDLAFRSGAPTDGNFAYNNPSGIEVSSGTTSYNENFGWEFVGPSAVATNSAWNVDANGTFTNALNWSAGVPQTTSATATFGNKITAPRTVTVDSNQAVGTLVFSSSIAYTLSGPGTLAIGSASGATVSVTAGSHTISSGLSLAGNASFTIATGAQLTAGNFNDASFALNKLGAGTLTVNRTRATTLTLTAGTMKLIAGGAPPNQVGSLSIAGGVSAPAATLDITDNDVIFTALSVTNAQTYVAFARDGGAWDNAGITTSSAAKVGSTLSSKGIGVITGTEYLSVSAINTAFDGVPVAAANTLLKFTYNGDADFSGKIDANDYGHIDSGYQNQKTVGFVFDWFHGDFDFNGVINANDYALIDAAYQLQSGTLRAAIDYLETGRLPSGTLSGSLQEVIDHNAEFGTAYATDFIFATVPEPATLGMFALAVAGLCTRRCHARHGR